MNIYKKLQTARVELQKTALKKSGVNKFAGFRYFELGDFIPAVNLLFEKHGMLAGFNIHKDVASLTIVNTDKPDEMIVFSSPFADANIKGTTPVQSLGGAHTYLKRYLYLNALEIVDNDVLDASVGTGKLETAPNTTKLVESIKALATKPGAKEVIDNVSTQAKEKFGLASWEGLPAISLRKVLRKLEAL
jgi:hypothetical protein